MACLSNCKYCGGTVCDSRWHVKCRLALAEDLLAQVKQAVADGKAADLPEDVKEKIKSEDWRKLPIKKKLEDFLKDGTPIPLDSTKYLT